MALSVPSTSRAIDTTIPTNAELKANLWNTFSPPSIPPDPSQSSITFSSARTGSHDGDKRSSSNTTNSLPPPKKTGRRARFENDPEILGRRRYCCRRCGREVAWGHKRPEIPISPPKSIPESIEEIPNEADEQAPPPPELRSVTPPPSLIILPEPVVPANQVKRIPPPPSLSSLCPQFRKVTSRATSDQHPTSAGYADSELVERTKGIMASLSPHHSSRSSTALSRSSSLSRSQTNATSPMLGRLGSFSQLIRSPKPTRRAMSLASGGSRSQSWSTDDLGRRSTISRIPQSYTRSPLRSVQDIDASSETVLDISRNAISRPEPDTSGSEDLPSPSKPIEPQFLELRISEQASVLCMSEYLESVFNRGSTVSVTSPLPEESTKDGLVSPESPPPPHDSPSRAEDSDQEKQASDNSFPSDWNATSSRRSSDSARSSSPMKFSDDRGDHSVGYTSERYRNWTGPPSRKYPRMNKLPLTWIPPASWAGPPEPQHLEETPNFSRSTTMSSINDALKPLTYLVHHQKTSSIDVCSTSDPAKASSEGTVDGEDSLVEVGHSNARSTRVRKGGWQESAILDALPKFLFYSQS